MFEAGMAKDTRHRSRLLPRPTFIRRVRISAASTAATLAFGLVAAWATGWTFTDRWVWSQWLYWVPAWIWATAAATLLLASAALAWRTPAGRRVRRAGGIGLAVLVLTTVAIDWRMWAWPLGGNTRGTIRVVGWNTGANFCPGAGPSLATLAPDLVVMSNQPARVDWDSVTAAMNGATVTRLAIFTIVSRYPIVRKEVMSLGLHGRILQFDASDLDPNAPDHIDNGWAAYVVLDATEAIGREMTVWAIDLPSDPMLGRTEMMRRVRASVAGFPTPDLIVGDFNTPRGSYSLTQLTGGLPSAYSHAGFGPAGTWPRPLPVFHIDHMFIGPALRATDYRIIDPEQSMHRLQVADLVKAPG
jgi:hypothetical protein